MRAITWKWNPEHQEINLTNDMTTIAFFPFKRNISPTHEAQVNWPQVNKRGTHPFLVLGFPSVAFSIQWPTKIPSLSMKRFGWSTRFQEPWIPWLCSSSFCFLVTVFPPTITTLSSLGLLHSCVSHGLPSLGLPPSAPNGLLHAPKPTFTVSCFGIYIYISPFLSICLKSKD